MGPQTFGESALVFGDLHVQAGEADKHLQRCNAIGRLALKYRPKTIICGGDLLDMPALAEHMGSKAVGGNGSTLGHQGKRVGQDIEAGKDAIRRIQKPIEDYNRACARAGRSGNKYKPRKVFLLGNHENRLNKVANKIPELADVVNVQKLLVDWLVQQGWEVYDGERETFWLGGIGFRHYFRDKMKNAIPITTAHSRLPRSSVWFHGHSMAMNELRYDGIVNKYAALPCMKPEHRLEEKEAAGVVFMNDILDGDFSINEIPYNRLMMHDIEAKGRAMAA